MLRWRLILEEFGPELVYLPGQNNAAADALSRLETLPSSSLPPSEVAESYGLKKEDLPDDAFPLTYKLIMEHQLLDQSLMRAAEYKDGYDLTIFRGGGKKRTLITKYGKIVMPKTLQKRCVNWYHESLCHPGMTRTEQTIRQHFTWKNLRGDVERVCKTCSVCQKSKRKTIKYGKIPVKSAEAEPWETLCVDLIGPYNIKHKKSKKDIILHAVTMIDPATGWFEIQQIPNKESHTVAEVVEQTWLSRYPWPTQIILDRGSEFMRDFTRMMTEDYGVKKKPITARNPQANSIIERVHQTIGQMIRTMEVQNLENVDNPFKGILSAICFAIRATVHTTLQASPSQLVFGRDHILNIKYVADWKRIRENKQRIIDKNNKLENDKRKEYQYVVGQKVLIKTEQSRKYGKNPYEGLLRLWRSTIMAALD